MHIVKNVKMEENQKFSQTKTGYAPYAENI